jgi:hypothetical protein
MKKRVVLLSLSVIALIAVIILIVLPADLNAAAMGHWIYDDQGNHSGCASPGTDCTWNPQLM